ncbi:hypothetical protein BJX76DRAFT_358997 [Aspergillus varians]
MPTETEFFNAWLGKTIEFTNFPQPSSWKLETKIGDKNGQCTAREYHEYGINSSAFGTFISRGVSDLNDIAVLKITMQVPYIGSEYAIHAERARQATETLTTFGRFEVESLETLTRNHCTSMPVIRNYMVAKQGDDQLVPGGVPPLHPHHQSPWCAVEQGWILVDDARGAGYGPRGF